MQIATEAVRQAMQQESTRRQQRGFELAKWELGKELAFKDMTILAWRLVPESKEVQHHQVRSLAGSTIIR